MKRINNKRLFLFVCALMTFSSCKKEKQAEPTAPAYTCSSCVQSPEANAEYDHNSRGVYKGILVASTGTIRFDIGNNGDTITAIMTIDNNTVTLSSNIVWQQNEPYTASFTGTLDGQPIAVTFSVQPDGSNPRVTTSSIPGHANASFTIAKETSEALIEAFEGEYSLSNGKKGVFNIIQSRALKKWGGIAREQGTTDEDHINGTLNGDIIILSDGTHMGTVKGDEISGDFLDKKGNTVTFSGKRTL